MEKKQCDFPVTDFIFRWLLGNFQKFRWSILGTLAGGLLAYAFAFTNKLPNFDDVAWLFGKGFTLESGRWGLIPLSVIFPDYSMPWLCGITALLILAVGICVIVELFCVRRPMLQMLLSAAIVCFPSWISTYTYMFTACAYAVAFSLVVLSVWFLERGTWAGKLAAVACLVYTVSIYQAYVAIASTLLILLLIRALMTTEDSAAALFARGVGYVVFLGISMGVYWLITKLLWRVTGTVIGEYASYALTLTPEFLLNGIKQSYVSFGEIFRYGINGLMPTFVSRVLHLLCLLAVGMEVLLWMVRSRNVSRCLLMVLLLVLLPMSICCMYLFIEYDAVHTLVLYSCAMLYVLFAFVAELAVEEKCGPLLFLRRFAREGLILSVLVITGTNITVANEVYLNLHLTYENTYAVTNTVIATVQNLPDYTGEEPIAILGTYQPPEYYQTYMKRLERLVAACGIRPSDYSAPWFWEYYCGIDAEFAGAQERQALQQTAEYRNMPSWPKAGSVRKIDEYIVVKFS